MVKFYKTSLLTKAELLPEFSIARAKIWSNYTGDKAYILQHSYSLTSVEVEPKFDKILHKTSLLTTAELFPDFEQEPKLCQYIHKTKLTYLPTLQ